MPVPEVGVVDVFVIQPHPVGWSVLVLQRSADTRCPGSWETVHGSIEPGETAEEGAVRELREETGLVADRLYSVTVHPFYVTKTHTVQLAVVFAAFVAHDAVVQLGVEHEAHEWLSVEEARRRFFWPSERTSLQLAFELLRAGDAGAAEDVLRVR